jgi:RNA polymerase sigma-70 factor, ECF subfamily
MASGVPAIPRRSQGGSTHLSGWRRAELLRSVRGVDDLTYLLVQATGGDRDALNEFVTRAQPDVWRFCAALLSADQADDATQETFVRAWRAASGFRGDSSAKTWLLAIAKRVCFDAMRQRVRADRRQDRLVAATQSMDAPDHGESVVMADLVDRLDPDRRSAFILTQLLGLSYEEAATVVGCPIGTIRSRVARARSDLQELLCSGEAPARASAGPRHRS